MGRSRLTAVADQCVRMLTDRTGERLVIISGLIAADFRLPAEDLRSREREQRIAFVAVSNVSVPKDHRRAI